MPGMSDGVYTKSHPGGQLEKFQGLVWQLQSSFPDHTGESELNLEAEFPDFVVKRTKNALYSYIEIRKREIFKPKKLRPGHQGVQHQKPGENLAKELINLSKNEGAAP